MPPLPVSKTLFFISMCGIGAQLSAQQEEVTFTPLWDVTWKDDHQWVEAANRRPVLIERAPQAVVVLNDEDLNNTPAFDIPQRLRYEAGIDVYQSRHGQIDIGIRGFAGLNSPRTVALIDGRDFNFEFFATPLWVGALHQTDIIRAEIVKGPSSVTYGANAFGGVISLQDREVGDFSELHTLVQMGSHGHYELDATSLGPLGHLNGPGPFYYKVSFGITEREDLDGLRGLEPGTEFPRARQNDEDNLISSRASFLLGTKLTHDHKLELEYYALDINKWDMIEDLAVGSNQLDLEQSTMGMRLIGPWGEARYLHTETDWFYSNSITTYNAASDYRYTQGYVESSQDQFRFQSTKRINDHHISFGIDYAHWTSFSPFWFKDALLNDDTTWKTVKTINRAAFIEDQWTPKESRWTINTAVRVDHHNIIGTNTSPRIAANYQIAEDQYARLSLSSGYRLPSPMEGYLDQYFYAISDDLEEETINSINVGWYKNWDEQATLSVDLFYNRTNNTPFFIPVDEAEAAANFALATPTRAPGPFFVYENTDNPATLYGAELSSEYTFEEQNTTTWVNITYQDFAFEDDIVYQSDGFTAGPFTLFQFDQNLGDDINGPPDWKVSVGANWESDKQPWQVSVAARYVSEREVFAFASSQWLTRDQASRATLDDYLVFDASVAYNWGYEQDAKRLLKLSVMDLFDQAHTEIYEVTVDELIDSGENQHTNEVGRSVVLSFIWEL